MAGSRAWGEQVRSRCGVGAEQVRSRCGASARFRSERPYHGGNAREVVRSELEMELLRARNGAPDGAPQSSRWSSRWSSSELETELQMELLRAQNGAPNREDLKRGVESKNCLGDHMSKSSALAPCSRKGVITMLYTGGPGARLE